MAETEPASMTFTDAISQLEEAGFNSMGFSIEDGEIVCLECDQGHSTATVHVGGMVRYQTDAGEGHVFALGCDSCPAKGLLFAGPETMAGGTGDIVAALEAQVRH